MFPFIVKSQSFILSPKATVLVFAGATIVTDVFKSVAILILSPSFSLETIFFTASILEPATSTVFPSTASYFNNFVPSLDTAI